MKVNTVNISFNAELLNAIDQVAYEESRARSELIREAARMYIARKQQWNKIFSFGEKKIKDLKLKETDVDQAIRGYRKSKER